MIRIPEGVPKDVVPFNVDGESDIPIELLKSLESIDITTEPIDVALVNFRGKLAGETVDVGAGPAFRRPVPVSVSVMALFSPNVDVLLRLLVLVTV
jgi:hypothetical protein